MDAIFRTGLAFLEPAAEQLRGYITETVKNQFSYLCCLDSNIDDLKNEAKALNDATVGLQMQVTAAKNNNEVIIPAVSTWLEEANEVQVSLIGIESDITNMNFRRSTAKSRYSLSKKVKQTTEAMKQLRDRCKFDVVSGPAPPASQGSVPFASGYEFESRKLTEEEIMNTLRDNAEFSMIGICGMGGVGKTTMVKRVMTRVTDEHLFDEKVMVVVSQQVDKKGIQDDIAKQLGLELKEGSSSSRAHDLRSRLAGGKRILIVVDDIWEDPDLEDLGIPSESSLKGCKILITSRDRGLLEGMCPRRNVYEIHTLNETEAWSLFEKKLGNCVDDQKLLSIAKEIANQCQGLLIALANVAAALRGKRRKESWKDALSQLKSPNPIDGLLPVLEKVYKPLKLSYDFLDSPHAKSLFLLCSLFCEDGNIPLQDLAVYAMGLQMFGDNIGDLEEARNGTYALVDLLVSRSLLLEGSDDDHVRMHDVVRDVSIFIASKERRIKCDDCTWLSSFHGEKSKLRMRSNISNLRLLLLHDSADEELQISDTLFEGMRELNVLSMKFYYSRRSLPDTTKLLRNLRTLHLESFESSETMSVVGELVNLEILICRYCRLIKVLPVEIARLDRLRLLEFSDCKNLKTIAPGVISSLVRLEELKMLLRSFGQWEAEVTGKERKNAGLSELLFLSSLTCLEIEISDYTLAAEQIKFPSKIVKYCIAIGVDLEEDIYDIEEEFSGSYKGFEKRMYLKLPGGINSGNWIQECVRSAEYMYIEGDGSDNLDLGQAQNVVSLTLRWCSTVEKLVNITASIDGRCVSTTIFPVLECLCLQHLDCLEEICDVQIPEGSSNYYFKNLKHLWLVNLPALKHLRSGSSPYQNNGVSPFGNLASVHVSGCHSLRNLLSLAMTNGSCHSQLESLDIEDCEMMEQVVLGNNEEGNETSCRHITFKNLKFLNLEILPRLTAFCKGIESIEFPVLTQMWIEWCRKLKSGVVAASSSAGNNQNNSEGISDNHDQDDEDSLHLFCKPEKVAFGGLKELHISGYGDTRSRSTFMLLWCHQIPSAFFTGLEGLYINNCDNIRSLFTFSNAENLVNLKRLEIESCEEMVKVIEDEEEKDARGGESHLFVNLKELRIDGLHKLKSFCEWTCALEFPSLEEVEVLGCPQMERFSLGSLSTPKLKIFCTGFGVSFTTKDMNDLQQQHFFRAKEEEERKKKEKMKKHREERGETEEEEEEREANRRRIKDQKREGKIEEEKEEADSEHKKNSEIEEEDS